MHEPPIVNVNNAGNENLQREVLHLENIENLSKADLGCNKINKNSQQNNRTGYKLQVLPLTVSYVDKELSVDTLLQGWN